jgi:signal recognition particle subunit SRP54
VFETLSDRLTQVLSSLRGKGRLSAADIESTCREIRLVLLEADVALPVAREFISRVRERASSEEVSAALNPTQQIIKIVHEELIAILGGEARRLRFAKTPPTVIMLAGLQGSGKTTLAAKLARWLKVQNNTPLLVAADLQRPNAVQQLQVLGEQAGVPVYAPEPGNGVGDPVAVARQSIAEARHRLHNVVVIDTAGRLGIDEEMMAQAAAIADATDPDEILFVVDAMIGQDAVTTAQAFLDGVGFDGVVLTKLDGDARGGAALSIAQLTGRPIMFASTGEKLEDFDVFHPDRMASRILDMGDMLTLIEQAERTFDAEQTAAMAGKLVSGEGFTLEDFVEQLAMVRKLGPISNLLGMLPGAAQNRELLSQINDSDLDRAAAIVNSMTPAERRNPKILNGSRRARIAKGSGTTVGEVNNLVVRFLEGQKMMRQMLGGGGIPGMPGIPGMRRAATKAAKGKKGSKKKPKGGRPGGAPGRSGGAGTAPGRSAGGAAGLGGAGLPGLGGAGLPGLGGAGLPGLGGAGLPGLGGAGGLGEAGGAGEPGGRREARGLSPGNLPGGLDGGGLPAGLGRALHGGHGGPPSGGHGGAQAGGHGGAQAGGHGGALPPGLAGKGRPGGAATGRDHQPASGAPDRQPGTGGEPSGAAGAADSANSGGAADAGNPGAGGADPGGASSGGADAGGVSSGADAGGVSSGADAAGVSSGGGRGTVDGGAADGAPGLAATDLPAGFTPRSGGRRLLGRKNKKR